MSESRPTLEPGRVVAEKYRLVRLLGQGGMGTVYEAVNVLTEKPVALKLLSADVRTPETRERLLREARLAARVQHPHVIDIYDVGFDGGSIFLVMELLRGRPLDVWLREHPRVDHGDLLGLILPVLRGLAVLHAQGVVHRDIKPANVFVTEAAGEPARAKLLDLGIARDGGPNRVALTDPDQIIGTPAYMAPEQIEHPDEVDARTDVYACGVTLYEALAGERPFAADSLMTLVTQILGSQPKPLSALRPDLPEGLSEVVARAMSRRRDARYADAGSLAEAVTQLGRSDRPAGTEPPPPRGRAWLSALVIAVLAALAVGMLMSLGGEPDLPTTDAAQPAESAPTAVIPIEEPEPESEAALDVAGIVPPGGDPSPAPQERVIDEPPAPPRGVTRPRRAAEPARARDEQAPRTEPARPARPAPHLELDPDDF